MTTSVDPNRKLFLPLRPDLRFVAMRKSTSSQIGQPTIESSKETEPPFQPNSATDIDFSSAHAESFLSVCERHKGELRDDSCGERLIVRRCASEWCRSNGGKGRKRETRQSEKDEGAEKKKQRECHVDVVDDCTVIGSPTPPYPLHLTLQSLGNRRHSAVVLITLTYGGRRTPRRDSTLLPRVRRIMAIPRHCRDRKSY